LAGVKWGTAQTAGSLAHPMNGHSIYLVVALGLTLLAIVAAIWFGRRSH
jgi:hypothetical protein